MHQGCARARKFAASRKSSSELPGFWGRSLAQVVESLTEEVEVKSLPRLVFLLNSSGDMSCVTTGAGGGFESTPNRYGRGLGAAGAVSAEGTRVKAARRIMGVATFVEEVVRKDSEVMKL